MNEKKITPDHYSKVTTKEHHELFMWANKVPLRWAVLMTISSRVRSSKSKLHNIDVNEFVFSQMEYKKFGLSASQKGKLYRIMMDLIRIGVVQKTDKQTDNAHASVYRFISSDFIDASRGIDNETDNKQIANRYRTDSEQIETNTSNSSNNNFKEKEKINKKEKENWDLEKMKEYAPYELYDFLKEVCVGKLKGYEKLAEEQFEFFLDYWLAKTKDGKSLLYQKQKTFDVVMRMRTWIRNRITHYQKNTPPTPNVPKNPLPPKEIKKEDIFISYESVKNKEKSSLGVAERVLWVWNNVLMKEMPVIGINGEIKENIENLHKKIGNKGMSQLLNNLRRGLEEDEWYWNHPPKISTFFKKQYEQFL